LLLGLTLGSGRRPRDPHEPVFRPGEKAIAVKDFAQKHGFRQVRVEEDHIVLKGQLHELELEKYSRRARLNGAMFWLNDPMVIQNRLWVLSETDVSYSLEPLLRASDSLQHAGGRVVVLDAGHGGRDSGAVSPAGLEEKRVVLDIAQRVRIHLGALGYRVLMTRNDDSFLGLEERVRRAEALNADLFVSIHANSGNPSAKGTETFVLALPGHRSTNQDAQSPVSEDSNPGNEFDEANMLLGFALHRSLVVGAGLEDRGVRRARFTVLREATFPAALVEVGFLSHPVEGADLARGEHREKIARAISAGLHQYLRWVNQSALAQNE